MRDGVVSAADLSASPMEGRLVTVLDDCPLLLRTAIFSIVCAVAHCLFLVMCAAIPAILTGVGGILLQGQA